MAKNRYKYNPKTLSFEPIRVSALKKFTNLTIQFGLSLLIAVIVFVAYTSFFDTPKEKVLKRNRSEALIRFELLAHQIQGSKKFLEEIQTRDNKIYRAIFDADTIPSSLRAGGMGGIAYYSELNNLASSELLIDIAQSLDQVTWSTYIQSKSFDEVIGLAQNKEKMIASVPAIQPISMKDLKYISSYYGDRSDPFTKTRRFHSGIDFAGEIGVPVYASGNGIVTTAKFSFFGYGNEVIVDHGFGYKTRYAHLNNFTVMPGDTVIRGQQVGMLGNSGRSTGPHLHYEVIYKGKVVNPINYFNDLTTEEYDKIISSLLTDE